MENILEIRDLRKSFGNHEVLRGVELTLARGEVLGLVGENGAGKSTLMKLITGVLRGTGSITIGGYDVTSNHHQAMSMVGYLPENNPLYNELYIAEYLLDVAAYYHLDSHLADKRAKELIEHLSLEQYTRQTLGTLSKGTRQRVGLAAAMIHDPALLILDEPTTGLDPRQLADLHQLIKSIAPQRAILLSTHIMQEISAICTRVVLLRNGVLRPTTTEQLQTEFR